MDIYQTAIRPILFSGLKADPEWLHQQTLKTLHWLDQGRDRPLAHWLCHQMRQAYSLTNPRLKQSLWGLTFPNPIGLAAGFDKDGIASGIWADFGFGFAELGTVTLYPQPGNPRPRLFRLPLDQAVLNRMGFNNQGAEKMAEILSQRWGNREGKGDGASYFSLPHSPFPFGINLGKSKVTPLEEATEDYLGSFRLLQDWGDYFVVNVSSPNTPGLRSLQAAENLEPILRTLQQENQQQKPLLVKIAPDLEWEDIAAVVDLARKHRLAGIIATNTTISRDGLKTQRIGATRKTVQEEAGGISGAPLRQRSTEVIHFIYKETQGNLPIVGVGGIFTAEDAWEKITAGASLIQVYTGWIYEGPWMVRRILSGLIKKMDEQGLESISQVIGRN
ncbi:quinone-dependent dihydroorotate dehydrogenase [Leptothermofonsia sp. ETS-13]|uniref:quinone-dependent dihydroorotate dehydrogenase n=1 Tax=Leptothermofonsia sp. ETS-13 TaxID=3035696 RepID=UPI003B9E9698